MTRPRRPGRWIAGGGALAAFVAVATAISSAGATATGAAPSHARPFTPPAHQGVVRGAHALGAVPGSYLVVLKNRTVAATAVNATATTLSAKYGGTVRRTFSHAIRGYSAQMTEAQAKSLAGSAEVAYVEQDRKVKVTATQPDPRSWGIDRIDQSALPLDFHFTYPNIASNVHAYVIDTGIRISHFEFGGRASYGFDFVDNDAVADDCAGHGTHVAGTIGGVNTGVAKGAQLVAVRVLDCDGNGTVAGVMAGVDWVTANAQKPAVANLSLGGGLSTALDDAVRNSIAAGITYSIAAGNDNLDACGSSPSDVTQAIVVGATDESDFRAPFSNTGTCVDVFAPGVDIVSSWIDNDSIHVILSGTSMAAPHVAGAAALLLSANPTMTPAQVSDAITNGAVNGAVHYAGTDSPNKLLNIAGTTPLSTPMTLLSHANNRYVSAESAGTKPLIANRIGAGAWEDFDQIDQGGGFVAFKSRANGKFVTAESGGAGALIANRAAVGAWEKFQVLPNGDGTVGIKANANGKFVTAENGGAGALIANRAAVGPWEKFDDTTPAGVMGFFSYGSNLFVTAEAGGTKPLIANRDAIGAWERFETVDVGGGFIALRSQANGMFVCADAGGAAPLVANRSIVGAWEKFRFRFNDDGTISLQANANGLFVTAGNGSGPLVANVANPDPNPTSPKPWEFLRIAFH